MAGGYLPGGPHVPSEKELDSVEEVYQYRQDSLKVQGDWRVEARKSYEFRDGNQWDSEDLAMLEEQQRPAVTFNRISPILDSIVGHEMDNRQEIRYMPRGQGDGKPNEVYTAAAQWVRDLCDAEDEESDGYHDAITCGMGWIETRVDYTLEPEGKIVMERVSPLEMRWDPNARKANVSDARWLSREKWLPLVEIKDRFPEKADEIDTASEVTMEREWMDEHDATSAWKYEQDQNWYDEKNDKALLIHFQIKELEEGYKVQDPASGKITSFTTERFNKLKSFLDAQGIEYAKTQQWVYTQRFIVGKVLLKEGPTPIDEDFSYHAITGKRDEEQGYWYGLTRVMIDPQEWANKFFSQAMHIFNSNAKGGVMIEKGAVVDEREFETGWASPDHVSWLEQGALTGGKVQEKNLGGYPSGMDKLMSFAISSIRDCSGVNLELLGMANRDQAGILEQERKKAALIVLKPLTNSLRRYRKNQGRALLSFMVQYIPEGTVVRITDEQALEFYKDEDVRKYDTIIDTSPSSPNLKSEIWSVLGNMLPAMFKAGVPMPPDLIKYSPLPESVSADWAQYIEQQSGMASPEQMQQMQEQMQKTQEENKQLKDKREEQQSQLAFKWQEAQLDAFLASEKLLAESKRYDQDRIAKMKISDADRAAKLIEIHARYDAEMEKLRESCNLEREIKSEDIASKKELQVISLSDEREKRQVEQAMKHYDAARDLQRSGDSKRAGTEFDKALTVGNWQVEGAEKIVEMMDEVEENTGKVDGLAGEMGKNVEKMDSLSEKFTNFREESDQRRAIILEYLKTQGGEVADIAKRLS